MTPQPNENYTYQDDLGNAYNVLFTPTPQGQFFPQFWGFSTQPQYDVPYTYMDSEQLYVVVFGGNVQLEANPMPSTDGTPGDSVFNIQVVQGPNPFGFDAYQFSIFGINPNQIYVSLAVVGNRGKIVTKPHIDSPVNFPSKFYWPQFKIVIEEEFNAALQSTVQRIEKLLGK